MIFEDSELMLVIIFIVLYALNYMVLSIIRSKKNKNTKVIASLIISLLVTYVISIGYTDKLSYWLKIPEGIIGIIAIIIIGILILWAFFKFIKTSFGR